MDAAGSSHSGKATENTRCVAALRRVNRGSDVYIRRTTTGQQMLSICTSTDQARLNISILSTDGYERRPVAKKGLWGLKLGDTVASTRISGAPLPPAFPDKRQMTEISKEKREMLATGRVNLMVGD